MSADKLLVAARGALAALSQNAVFPADVAAARKWLSDALADGLGNEWPKCGDDCRMEIVRPGKVQCDCPQFSSDTGANR